VLLNYSTNIVKLIQYICIHGVYLIPLALTSYYTNVQDLYSRLLVNDFIINSFYYLWTSFWYIPFLLFSLICYLLINNTCTRFTVKFLIILLLWFFFAVDLVNYAFLNLNGNYVLTHAENFNNLLSNSVNKYHPGIFYVSSLPVILTLWLYNILTTDYTLSFNTNSVRRMYLLSAKTNLILVVFTLFLGGWWALQEGSWGGWWNWDPSEVFGLMFIFLYAWQLHQPFIKSKVYYILATNIIIFYGILLIYFFIQLNFDLVSHNFGTKTDQFIDATQFYELNLFFILNLALLHIYSNHRYIFTLPGLYRDYYITNYRQINALGLWIIATGFIITWSLLSSFLPLLNDFLWKIFNTNITNSVPNWTYLNLLLLLLIYIYFWQPGPTLVFTWLYYIPLFSYQNVNLTTSYVKLSVITVLHLAIILALNTSIINSIFVSSMWSLQPLSLSNSSLNTCLYYYETVKLNNNFIELNHFLLTNSSLTTTFNFLLFDTSSEVYAFVLHIYADLQQQSLILGSLFYNYTINTYDFSPQSIFNLFLVWLAVSKMLPLKKQVIVF